MADRQSRIIVVIAIHVMGGTCLQVFQVFIHSTGSPGVPLLMAEYTKKRRRRK